MPKINKSKLKAATLVATVIAAFAYVFFTLYPSVVASGENVSSQNIAQPDHQVAFSSKAADEPGK